MRPEQAIEDLRIIRQIMSRTAPAMVLSGWQGVSWGVLFLVGGLLTHKYCVVGNTSFRSPVLGISWIALIVAGSLLEIYFYLRKGQKQNLPVFTPLIRHLFIGYTVIFFMGGVFHWVFAHLGQYTYIPGGWMLIFGAGAIFGGLFSLKEIWVLGIVILFGGILAVGPFLDVSFLIAALFGGLGMILWGIWVNRRLGG